MALVNITEYSLFGVDHMGKSIQAGNVKNLTVGNTTFSTSTEVADFSKSSRMVRVVVDADAAIAFGDADGGTVTATTADTWLIANTPEYFSLDSSKQMKCALVVR